MCAKSIAQLREPQPQEVLAECNEKRRLEQKQAHRFVINLPRANYLQRQQVHQSFTSDPFLRLSFNNGLTMSPATSSTTSALNLCT